MRGILTSLFKSVGALCAILIISSCGSDSNLGTPLGGTSAAYTGLLSGSVGSNSGYNFTSVQYSSGQVVATWAGPFSTSGTLTGTASGLTLTITGLTQAGCTVSSVSGSATSSAVVGGSITGTINATISGGATCQTLTGAAINLTKS